MKKLIIRCLIIGCCILAADFFADGLFGDAGLTGGVAEAIIGRPLTPISVAGTARRTTRRVIRRTTVYVVALPGGCRPVVISGATLYQCGVTYYQPYGNQYVVVTVH